MIQYTLARQDALLPGYGYVVSQHHTKRRALAALRRCPSRPRHVLLYTAHWCAKGSTIALGPRFLVVEEQTQSSKSQAHGRCGAQEGDTHVLAILIIDIFPGTPQRWSFQEACRLSTLLGVGVRYAFSDTEVLVNGTTLVYALRHGPDGAESDDDFIAHVTQQGA